MFPPRGDTTICFAHAAYRLHDVFARDDGGLRSFQVWNRDELLARLPEADVLVLSGLWRDDLLDHAPKLRFVQSVSAGINQYGLDALKARGVRLASAQGANERAVSEHAMALILALSRRLPEAVLNQARAHWRPMIGEIGGREDELAGKTLLIVGLGRIGGRLARLAKAFDLTVIGVRQNPNAGLNGADEVHGFEDLATVLPRADIVALTCPLTPQTENIVDARALGLMKPGAQLVNVARGRCVEEAALLAALGSGALAAAALDVTVEEPLPASSPLWRAPNVLITPHSAGETRRYEENVLALLRENLHRLWRGESELKNGIV